MFLLAFVFPISVKTLTVRKEVFVVTHPHVTCGRLAVGLLVRIGKHLSQFLVRHVSQLCQVHEVKVDLQGRHAAQRFCREGSGNRTVRIKPSDSVSSRRFFFEEKKKKTDYRQKTWLINSKRTSSFFGCSRWVFRFGRFTTYLHSVEAVLKPCLLQVVLLLPTAECGNATPASFKTTGREGRNEGSWFFAFIFLLGVRHLLLCSPSSCVAAAGSTLPCVAPHTSEAAFH